MQIEAEVNSILARFPADCQPIAVEFLGAAGGFSGALFWRFDAPRGRLCLRRWPKSQLTAERLQFLHGVLRHVQQQGFHLAVPPLETSDGVTFVERHGHLWEVARWAAGNADFQHRPTSTRLNAAMTALAEFHAAAESFPHGRPRRGRSEGMQKRRQRLAALNSGGLAELSDAVRRHHRLWPELAERTRRLLELFPLAVGDVLGRLNAGSRLVVPLQPCIRDIWHDHIFFEADAVSGIIDFGAMRLDNIATDVARLLGSLVGDDASRWRQGLSAYARKRPLSPDETALVQTFDQSSVLLSGISWAEWVFQQQRQFEDPTAIEKRFDALLQRMITLANK